MMPTFSLAALTVLEFAPPELVTVVAACRYDHVGIRLLPPTAGGLAYPLMEDAAGLKETLARLDAAKAVCFDDCATAYTAAHRTGWRNSKHAGQWANTPSTYCSPIFGTLPVHPVDVGLVLEVVEPLWAVKPETASRLRRRIERILVWAKVRGYREGDNPAKRRGARCKDGGQFLAQEAGTLAHGDPAFQHEGASLVDVAGAFRLGSHSETL
jgi:Phage integrase central domain